MADGLSEAEVRAVVKEEIASLAGKALRRTQDEAFSRSFTRNEATDAAQAVLAHFWGEVLSEYGNAEWPVPKAPVDTSITADYADSAE